MERHAKLTVAELIEVLKTLPQDSPFYVQGMADYYIYKDYNSVLIDTEFFEENTIVK